MKPIEPELPGPYDEVLTSLKEQVRTAQSRAQRVVNVAMLRLYWGIGRTILDRQTTQPWGTKVLDRLAGDLRSEFPHMRGFSRRNLFYMRAFAAAWDWPDAGVQSSFAQLPWGHIIELLKLKDPAQRDWYATQARCMVGRSPYWNTRS